MYFKTTKQYLHCHLSNRAADIRLRTLYKNEAAKILERAQKIKAFRRDVAPVVRVELSAGEICVGVSTCHQNVFRGAAVYPSQIVSDQGFFPPRDPQKSPTFSLE